MEHGTRNLEQNIIGTGNKELETRYERFDFEGVKELSFCPKI